MLVLENHGETRATLRKHMDTCSQTHGERQRRVLQRGRIEREEKAYVGLGGSLKVCQELTPQDEPSTLPILSHMPLFPEPSLSSHLDLELLRRNTAYQRRGDSKVRCRIIGSSHSTEKKETISTVFALTQQERTLLFSYQHSQRPERGREDWVRLESENDSRLSRLLTYEHRGTYLERMRQF